MNKTSIATAASLLFGAAACGSELVATGGAGVSAGGLPGAAGASSTAAVGGNGGSSALPMASGGTSSGSSNAGSMSSAGASSGAAATGTGGAVSTGGVPSAGGAPGGSGGELGMGGVTAGGGSAGGQSGGQSGAGTGAALSTLPDVVTSGPNDYWNTTAVLTEVPSTGADLTVDTSSTFQTWDGFGGTFNEMGWDALSVVSEQIPYAMTLLFDAEEGAGFVYGRIPIGASDYSMSWYTLAETTNDYEMADFSIERDREMLIPFINAALEVNPGIRFWGSPWVVPSWMMDGRAMRDDAQTLEAHALYFARFIEEYGTEGIEIEAVQQQNEPGYARVSWTHALFIDFIKSYLGPKIAERGLSAEVWCGTMSHPDDADIAIAITNDPDALQYVSGFGLQWNHEATVAALAPFGPVMQTEHRCGNYNFEAQYWDQSRYDPNMAQNDHLYGEESWQLIRDWIVGGVNSYVAWNMVLDTEGKSLDGWPQNALLVVDRATEELIITPAYYVFRHYSQYIAPGATRVGVSGTSDAVAFQNPDGSVVTQIYNSGDASQTLTLDVDGVARQLAVPAHGWATVRITP